MMAAEDNSWRTPAVRQHTVSKINDAIQKSGMSAKMNCAAIEDHVFVKAKTHGEYIRLAARHVYYINEIGRKKRLQDPHADCKSLINLLQKIRQGANRSQLEQLVQMQAAQHMNQISGQLQNQNPATPSVFYNSVTKPTAERNVDENKHNQA